MTARSPYHQITVDERDLANLIAGLEWAVDYLGGMSLGLPHYLDGDRAVMRPVTRNDVIDALNRHADMLALQLYELRERAP